MKVFIQGLVIAAVGFAMLLISSNIDAKYAIIVGFFGFIVIMACIYTMIGSAATSIIDSIGSPDVNPCKAASLVNENHEKFRYNDTYIDKLPEQEVIINAGNDIKVVFSGKNRFTIFGYGPKHILCIPHRNSNVVLENKEVWLCTIIAVYGGSSGGRYLIVDPKELIIKKWD